MDDVVDLQRILRLLPHRYPFLMIDKVHELEPKKRIVAIKNVSNNEPQFQGHFPGRPIMPGVMILEAFAQAAVVMMLAADADAPENQVYYYVGIDDARFKRPVLPGDQLELEVMFDRAMRGIGKFSCVARVAGDVVAEATILCTIQPAGK
jgi:3-hydroxyacyl-[acyl-carrier-protein] dehydratase